VISAFGIEHTPISKSQRSKDAASLAPGIGGLGGITAAVGHELKGANAASRRYKIARGFTKGGLGIAAGGTLVGIGAGMKTIHDRKKRG
jgi:hypothetical protein